MKRAKVLLLAVALLLVLSSATVFANGNVWWESLSQVQRNQQIVNGAWQDYGKTFDSWNGQCKVWVQNMVHYNSVSQGHVWLPSNNPAPNDWYWSNDPYYHDVGMSGGIESVQPGWIVQMHLTSGNAHTAVVVYKDSSGVGFIESNWPLGSYTVHYRYVTFSVFKSQVTMYSVHYIR